MKAEHRKELQTNVLADQIGRTVQRFKEGPSRTSLVWLGAIIVIAVLYIVWSLVSQHTREVKSDLWEEWYSVSTPSDLEKFAKDHDKTLPGRLARFRSARLDLARGLSDYGDPAQRSQAIDTLRMAAQTYEGLMEESAAQPFLQQEAMLNAARAYVTLDEADKARSLYQRLQQAYPKTPSGRAAAAAIERLEKDGKDIEALKKLSQETAAKPASK